MSCIIKAIYKKQDKGESLPYGLLSLDTLYEMVLSHSRFLNILLSTDKNMDAKGKDWDKWVSDLLEVERVYLKVFSFFFFLGAFSSLFACYV